VTRDPAFAIREPAFAKVNLVLEVGAPRPDGLHPVCSLVASLDLADELKIEAAERDELVCPDVRGPNLAADALAAFRREAPGRLAPLSIRITKARFCGKRD
jgi:4-diphosphocytidyl-2-C-methyl-D-erythritol kinase